MSAKPISETQATAALMTCPMCGTRFDPAAHVACQACPLNRGCQLVCCPQCGYEMVDARQSFLARWAARLLKVETPH
jgi:hypothetical protein